MAAHAPAGGRRPRAGLRSPLPVQQRCPAADGLKPLRGDRMDWPGPSPRLCLRGGIPHRVPTPGPTRLRHGEREPEPCAADKRSGRGAFSSGSVPVRRAGRSAAAQSELVAPGVRRSRGRWCPTSVSTEVSEACTVTSMAAITWPFPSRTGAAAERMPPASSSSASAQPRARTSRSTGSSSSASVCQRGVTPDLPGSASASRSRSGAGAASNTLPWDVGAAGNRVPIATANAMISGPSRRTPPPPPRAGSSPLSHGGYPHAIRLRAPRTGRCGRPSGRRVRRSAGPSPQPDGLAGRLCGREERSHAGSRDGIPDRRAPLRRLRLR